MLVTRKLSGYVAHKLSGRNGLQGGGGHETDKVATGDPDDEI